MMNVTRCGYCCELCKAYAPNINHKDQREDLSKLWQLYYDLDIPVKDIYCEGCLNTKSNPQLLDNNCPVRNCVTDKKLRHCGECSIYPCDTFHQRKGLSKEEMIEINKDYKETHYKDYLVAYDNKTRLDEYQQKQ